MMRSDAKRDGKFMFMLPNSKNWGKGLLKLAMKKGIAKEKAKYLHHRIFMRER